MPAALTVVYARDGFGSPSREMPVLDAKELRPFDLPYTADILEARGYGHARGGSAAAILTDREPLYPGSGSASPSSCVVTAASGSSTAGPSPPAASAAPSLENSRGSHIFAFDPL